MPAIPPPPLLPLLQRLMQLYKLWHEYLPHVPKTARYTLGSKIDALFVETLECIAVASYLPPLQKLPVVQRAASKADTLKFFLQVAWEIKALDTKKYAALSEPLQEIGRMLGGWYKNLLAKQTPPR